MTYKTVFLVTLATAKTVSEIHALSARHDCLRLNQDGSVTLRLQTFPGFVTKNKRPTDGNQRVTIQPLDQPNMLCPVRALKIYLQRTREKRWTSDPLFLSIRHLRGKTSSQLISIWIKATIALAYKLEKRAAHGCRPEGSFGPQAQPVISQGSHQRRWDDQ